MFREDKHNKSDDANANPFHVSALVARLKNSGLNYQADNRLCVTA